MVRKNLYFDTNVCIDLAKEIAPEERQGLSRLIREQYTYCISPVTTNELLAGLAGAGAADFEVSREPLKILYGVGRRKFLPFPVVFVFQCLCQLTLEGIENYSQAKADRWLRVTLAAKDKDSLLSGSVELASSRRFRFGVDLHESRRALKELKDSQIERIKLLQAGAILPAPPDFWTNSFFRLWLNRNGTPAERKILAERLDILYQLDQWIWKHATVGGTINPEKQKTLLADCMQLYYLCDPNNYFLTADRSLKTKVLRSPQSAQIILWQELRKQRLTPSADYSKN